VSSWKFANIDSSSLNAMGALCGHSPPRLPPQRLRQSLTVHKRLFVAVLGVLDAKE
jgi:hypothetical protein